VSHLPGTGSLSRGRRAASVTAGVAIVLGTALVLLPLFLVLHYLITNGIGAIDAAFFTQLPRPPGQAGGGVVHAIAGSGVLLLLASLLGVSVGVATGIFLAEYRHHPLAAPVRLMADVLTGVPAIVTGLVVYGVLVLAMGRFSALSGGVALGCIMIPYVVRATEEVLRLVPRDVREAGAALGLPRWRVTISVVLPGAASGILTGVMLAVARVAGEAAPLLFTAFGNQFWNRGLDQPISALPLVIYTNSISPYPEGHRLAFAASLLLVGLVTAATLLSRLALRRHHP